MGILSGLFSSGANDIASTIIDGADKLFTSKEEKAAAAHAARQAEIMHQERLKQLELQAEKVVLEDRASARQMQQEALRQNDTFSKRFVYYLAIMILLAAIGFGAALMFVEIPDQNKRMVEMFADIFLFSGAMIVIQFFFGSSRGSDEKNSLLKDRQKENLPKG